MVISPEAVITLAPSTKNKIAKMPHKVVDVSPFAELIENKMGEFLRMLLSIRPALVSLNLS